MVTVCSAVLGSLAGLIFGLGWGWAAGLVAAAAQVLDGVDGQLARLTGRASRSGAFMDSVLDRYADGAMVIGLTVYLIHLPLGWPAGLLVILGALAVIGSGSISYSTARAETLDIDLGRPTLASKGTRTSVIILCAWGSLFWPPLPAAGLIYLVLHPNAVVMARVINTHRSHKA
jgi:phosphatidylglycerophosphate synthase